MTAISYEVVWANYPRKKDISGDALYVSIGRPEYAGNPYMENTCAVRVSLALVAAGVKITPGHMEVKAGRFKGKQLEQGVARLSAFLTRRLGAPEKYKSGNAARSGIGQRRGVMSFFQLNGPTDTQGHIDLVAPDEWNTLLCAGVCYWSAVEFWFWPLK